MRYTVRSPEGSLSFSSRKELLEAYRVGLVSADDEIQDEANPVWQRADTVLGPRPAEASRSPFASPGRMLLLVGGGGLALWLLLSGDLKRMAFGAVIAFGLVMSMFTVTQRASQLKRRR